MDGPTLIMIHGLVGSLDYFDPQSRLPTVHVVTEDLLGYGMLADAPRNKLRLAEQANHIARVIDESHEANIWLLGHSMGGAIAMMVARKRADRIAGIINVEGNFTEQDAFWSNRIAAQTLEEWTRDYATMQANVSAWVTRCGVEPTPQVITWAEHILANQPARTVHAMSNAIVEETAEPSYERTIVDVLDTGIPIHLLSGASSAPSWGVPDFVKRQAASYTEQPTAGHLMMLEDPDGFCDIVTEILNPHA